MSSLSKPIEVKIARLTERLKAQFEEGGRLEVLIRRNLRRVSV